jgi:alpha-1,2-mannosyltransferase
MDIDAKGEAALSAAIPDRSPLAEPHPAIAPGAPPDQAVAAGRRRIVIAAIAVLAVVAGVEAVHDIGAAVHGWSMLDLHVYRWGGHLARIAGRLYSARFQGLPTGQFTYPPFAALLFAALDGFSFVSVSLLFTIASICGLAATLWLIWGQLGYRAPAIRTTATLACFCVVMLSAPVLRDLALGQVNILLMLLIVSDLCQPGRSRLKGIGIGLAAGFKLTPLIFIGYLLLTRQFRAALTAVGTFALTVAVALAVRPAQTSRYWFTGLFLHSGRVGSNSYAGNQSLNGTLARIAGVAGVSQHLAAAAFWYWLAAAIIFGVVGLLLAARAYRLGKPMLAMLICALTGLLISPVSWGHHWVWIAAALPVAADMAIRASSKPPARAARLRFVRSISWAGVVALLVPFAFLPEKLADGSTGIFRAVAENLYVMTGLILLALIARYLARSRRPA